MPTWEVYLLVFAGTLIIGLAWSGLKCMQRRRGLLKRQRERLNPRDPADPYTAKDLKRGAVVKIASCGYQQQLIVGWIWRPYFQVSITENPYWDGKSQPEIACAGWATELKPGSLVDRGDLAPSLWRAMYLRWDSGNASSRFDKASGKDATTTATSAIPPLTDLAETKATRAAALDAIPYN